MKINDSEHEDTAKLVLNLIGCGFVPSNYLAKYIKQLFKQLVVEQNTAYAEHHTGHVLLQLEAT